MKTDSAKNSSDFSSAASGLARQKSAGKEGLSSTSSEYLDQGIESVLIVDDNSEIRELITAALSSHGITSLNLPNCEDALKVFKKHFQLIPLVIVDDCMPGMAGHELVDEVHKVSPGTKVILMSGYYADDLHPPFLDRSFAAFLEKPFKIPRLLELMEKLLSGKSVEPLKPSRPL